MGDVWSAIVDVATNESAYRNATIAAVVLLFAASGELVAEKAGTINISLEAMPPIRARRERPKRKRTGDKRAA
jgi:hypothetical protein